MRTVGRCLAVMLCLALPLAWAQAEEPAAPELESVPLIEPGFAVLKAESQLVDGVVRLDAQFDLQFSDQLVEALQNGISLNLLIEIEISKQRSYLWSAEVARLEQRYQISYQPLTNYYVLNILNSELEFQFATFESLLAVITTLNGFPLLDQSLLEADADYFGEIRIAVDRNSFPVPLRLMSYVSGDWHLASDWYSWPLLP